MPELSIELDWQHSAPNFHSAKYSSAYTVRYNDNCELQVDAAAREEVQQRAHRFCFIANSLADSIRINIVNVSEPSEKHSRQRQQNEWK